MAPLPGRPTPSQVKIYSAINEPFLAPLPGGPTPSQVKTYSPVNEPFLAPLPGKPTQKSTYQVPITISISRITLFAICLSFSSPPLHPCRFIRPLSLSSLSFSICLFLPACFLFACVLVCLFVTMALPKFGDLHLKRLEEIENNIRKFMVLQFEHNNFFRNELKE